jgi:hypothetical protein
MSTLIYGGLLNNMLVFQKFDGGVTEKKCLFYGAKIYPVEKNS